MSQRGVFLENVYKKRCKKNQTNIHTEDSHNFSNTNSITYADKMNGKMTFTLSDKNLSTVKKKRCT